MVCPASSFVQGTDHEVILIIEAIGAADRSAWHYAIVRATGGGLRMKLRDTVVWEAEKMPTENDKTLPHFTDYPSLKP